jgi:hypothetical protein
VSAAKGPEALYAQLEAELDAVFDRYREQASKLAVAGFALEHEEVRAISARLISITSKLAAFEDHFGRALGMLGAARRALGDPITDEEIGRHTVTAERYPGIVPAPSARAKPN